MNLLYSGLIQWSRWCQIFQDISRDFWHLLKCGLFTEKRSHLGLCLIFMYYLRHVDGPNCQCLESQNGPVLVFLPSLEHDVQLVALPLEEVWVLKGEAQLKLGVQQGLTSHRQQDFVRTQGSLGALKNTKQRGSFTLIIGFSKNRFGI